MLLFGGPLNEVVTKEEAVPGGGSSSRGASGPVHVGVGSEFGDCRRFELNFVCDGAFDVSYDAFESM